ncbi:MAG: aspartyl/asparaginyl beta-hydroxylase domain-containing protein [Candidatus Pacebacteria bacterium]|nr:aspartyl/asparaginyl beta-hydroxylase domain-containing protein [Candidatus Paceibacterota bacterium]MBP9866714.1 aspartyl/asparaginyl beta-hydroxylase domain-containing protein [Candidatus Paceibacterota bacterium]
MKQNFKLIKKDVDVSTTLLELSNFLEKNTWSNVRSKNISYHENTKHVSLREHKINRKDNTVEYYRNSGNIITVPQNAPYFTKTISLLKIFEKELGGQLERVMIVTLDGNSNVKPHIDEGSYYLTRDRYHLVLKTNNSINFCGSENQIYNTGELWWFDNKKMHHVENRSNETRIHIIFDVLKKKKSLRRNIIDVIETSIYNTISRLL